MRDSTEGQGGLPQMKIIDAHLHFSKCDHFDGIASAAGHENSGEHLKRVFGEQGVILAVAMGEMGGGRIEGVCTVRRPEFSGMSPESGALPPFIAWCAGVESTEINSGTLSRSLELFSEALKEKACVGLKFYPGYDPVLLSDPRHDPYFELAETFDVPVVVHTGSLSGHGGLLKYSHPLTVDEAAVRFPRVRFVMAHCGDPWIVDAAAVAGKNSNVFMDLSGLAVGNFTADWFCDRYRAHLDYIRHWLTYLDDWEKIMYGSDWPLVNIPAYIEVVRRLVPEEHHGKVFFENACRVFPKLAALAGL